MGKITRWIFFLVVLSLACGFVGIIAWWAYHASTVEYTWMISLGALAAVIVCGGISAMAYKIAADW
ncbi:MAG: hypothetical protein GY906_24115 [bacterium]|nr:hypothetical protein [bacterium]